MSRCLLIALICTGVVLAGGRAMAQDISVCADTSLKNTYLEIDIKADPFGQIHHTRDVQFVRSRITTNGGSITLGNTENITGLP